MREDNPATEVANSFAECLSACVLLCMRPSEARRDAILDAVSWFVEAAPLGELPAVRSFGGLTKEMIRDGAVIAAQLKTSVLAWDGATEPPLSLASLARAFLVTVGMDGILGPQASKEPG